MADDLENKNNLVEPGDKGQGGEEDNFDPLAQFREAEKKQKGVKHPSPPIAETPPPETDIGKTENTTEGETSTEGTGKGNPNPNDDLGEEIIIDDSEIVPPNTNKPPSNKGSTMERLVDVSSKALVEKGDRIQQSGALIVYDWRSNEALSAAQEDYDKLFSKVLKGTVLNEKETARLNCADRFIKECAAYRKELEQKTPMSQEDLKALIELLTTYFEETNSKPHPLLLLVVLVGGTLFSNFYSAFTMPPKYNPPPL